MGAGRRWIAPPRNSRRSVPRPGSRGNALMRVTSVEAGGISNVVSLPSITLPSVGSASVCIDHWREQLGHRLNLHVAVLQLPFIITLQENGSDQSEDCAFIREDTDDVCATFTSLLTRSREFTECNLVQCWAGKSM